MRKWLLAGLCLGLTTVIHAQERDEDAPVSFSMRATMVDANPFIASGRNESFPIVLHRQDDRTRVDFRGPRGQRGMLLHDARSGNAWLISLDEAAALPISNPGFDNLVVDPQDPCAHMRVRCDATPSRFVAGRTVRGWRYRGAQGRGPGGTSEGRFWVEAEHGVVVAYSGRKRGLDKKYEMEATSISFGELPEALFQPPREIPLPDGEDLR